MDKNYIIALLVIVVVALLFLNYFPSKPIDGKNVSNVTELNEAGKLFLTTFDRSFGENYNYSYYEKRGEFEFTHIFTTYKENRYAFSSTVAGSRETFFSERKNETVVCTTLSGSSRKCSFSENTSSMNSYLTSLNSRFLNESNERKSKDGYRLLIEKGALVFDNEIKDKQVDGVACKEISFVRDYSFLTVLDRIKLGITSGPDRYQETWCISGNEPIEKSVKTYVNGQEVNVYFKLLKADYNMQNNFSFTPNLTNERAEPIILDIIEKESNFESCYSGKDRGLCFFNFAIRENDVSYCSAAGNKSASCYINFAIGRSDVSFCSFISDISYFEDCYLEVAGFSKNPSLCNEVKDPNKHQMCLNVSNSS